MTHRRMWTLSLILLAGSGLACNLLGRAALPTPTAIPPTETAPILEPTAQPTELPTESLTLPTAQLPPTVIPTAAQCAPPANWTVYTVVRGDTLYSIARRSGTTVADLAAVNCLPDANRLEVGQTLYVPNEAATLVPTRSYGLEIYLIVLNDNGASGPPVGCGDSAILEQTDRPMTRDTATDLRAALEAMFATRTGNTTVGIVNAYESSPLTVQSVTVTGDTATVRLGGPLMLLGTCADARMEAQLVLNVFHFPDINTALITVDGRSIKQIFDMSGRAGAADPYTRADADRLAGVANNTICTAQAPTPRAILDLGMGTSARTIGELPANVIFTVWGYFSHTGMYQITYGGINGWISGGDLIYGAGCADLRDYTTQGLP